MLMVFLVMLFWDFMSGEMVVLKLQVCSVYGICYLSWQGDIQVLSLMVGMDICSIEGWIIIMLVWDYCEGVVNCWCLLVVVEDEKGQCVFFNEIMFVLIELFIMMLDDNLYW